MSSPSNAAAYSFAETYRAKKGRWDALIGLVQTLPEGELEEFVGKLLTMLEDGVRPTKAKTLKRESLLPTPPAAPVTAFTRDWSAKPRYSDLAKEAIKASGKKLSAAEIFSFAKKARPEVKKTSFDTIVSRLASHGELTKGEAKDGTRLYGLPA